MLRVLADLDAVARNDPRRIRGSWLALQPVRATWTVGGDKGFSWLFAGE